MALAAQAAAAAAVKRQPSPLTPASLASPSHATHDYTPGSLAGSVSISRELPIPETLTSRRAELDGSQQIAGERVVVSKLACLPLNCQAGRQDLLLWFRACMCMLFQRHIFFGYLKDTRFANRKSSSLHGSKRR